MYPVAREKLEPEENSIGECQETQVIADVESAVTKQCNIRGPRSEDRSLTRTIFHGHWEAPLLVKIFCYPQRKRLSMLKIQEHGPIAEMIICNDTALAKEVMVLKATRSGLDKNNL